MKLLLPIIIYLSVISSSFASELMKSGDVLTQDSVVFTMEEAQDMRLYILELESKIKSKDQIIALKDELIVNKDKQIESFEEYIENKDFQIQKYKEISQLDQKRIKDLNRQLSTKKFENAGAFSIGIIVAIGAIIVADRLDDNIIEKNF